MYVCVHARACVLCAGVRARVYVLRACGSVCVRAYARTCMCCARVCVRLRARACVCVCVCVCA